MLTVEITCSIWLQDYFRVQCSTSLFFLWCTCTPPWKQGWMSDRARSAEYLTCYIFISASWSRPTSVTRWADNPLCLSATNLQMSDRFQLASCYTLTAHGRFWCSRIMWLFVYFDTGLPRVPASSRGTFCPSVSNVDVSVFIYVFVRSISSCKSIIRL